MQKILAVTLCLAAFAFSTSAQNGSRQPLKLLDRLTGSWVLQGTIAGKPTTHDVRARWLLHREYLEIHEVSREKDARCEPAYEAIILVSWDAKAGQFACLWLDSTSGGGLTSPTTCRATPSGDSIPFIFTISPSESLHTTFAYSRATGTWQWLIDDVTNGKADRFADVVLSKAK